MQHTLQQRLPLHTRAVTPKMWQRIVSGNSPTPRAVHRPRHIADSACRCAPGPSSSSSGDIDGVNKANGRQLASSPTYAVSQQAVEAPSFPTSLPLLPFPAEEVLTPGAVKTLHLYEVRPAACFNKSMYQAMVWPPIEKHQCLLMQWMVQMQHAQTI